MSEPRERSRNNLKPSVCGRFSFRRYTTTSAATRTLHQAGRFAKGIQRDRHSFDLVTERVANVPRNADPHRAKEKMRAGRVGGGGGGGGAGGGGGRGGEEGEREAGSQGGRSCWGAIRRAGLG